MPEYVHLHNHTEFSLLDGAGKIEAMMEKACNCGMKAVGISDHGNLYGVPKFVTAAKAKKLKPVIGSEFYLCEDMLDRTKSTPSQEERENENRAKDLKTFHQILFAKNDIGYKNLCKLSSRSFTEGYYYKPRIDRKLLAAHCEGLIATTCCLASEINNHIRNNRLDKAEEVFRWYLDHFGEDYYVELQRHGLADQDKCNHVLLGFAAKYNVKVIATNDVHYINIEDADAHDLLLALQTGANLNELDKNGQPKARFRFTDDRGELNRSFYFKTQEEMGRLFADLPHALDNTMEIADKAQFELKLNGDLFLPVYPVPSEFKSMDDYLASLSWERARHRYGDMTTDLEERIRHELKIIEKMGYAGYFLIVQEFTTEARKRKVLVGPGRGSAAGSVIAYCLGITDIDPIRYDLLFERFLNPERVSPPDIDIDFDDEGRQEVINFVIDRYGKQSVSQIITYGTMGAKTAIRDVGRVMGIPLGDVNRIAKYIPDSPSMDFAKALKREENPEHWEDLKKALDEDNTDIQKMLRFAMTLEGTARHTGIHAAGVIIAPGELTDYAPVAINNTKDHIIITQYDGPMAEKAGLLKMDFLGLKTLSIIKTALRLIKARNGVDVDLDNVSLEDPKTYELYQKGETVATFQFESDGMRKYLKQLQPTTIEDLIAMNALYRPGPMDNIPLFIERKQGRSPIEYPHPLLEPILRTTYGIMVYQEQIMLCAQVVGGYSLAEADLLRRAMGKKKKEEMEKQRATFVQRAQEKDLTAQQAGSIFDTMEKFAEYGFNKSHSAAYSVLAYRTAYLKANYPAEYMAAVLSHWQDNIERITQFIEEARRMGIPVLPPCVNESQSRFTVTPVGHIRFGLGAIKGLGDNAVESIIEKRFEDDSQIFKPYKSIFDLTSRIPSRVLNRKSMECLVYAGAFDTLSSNIHRAQYFVQREGDDQIVLDRAVQYGQRIQAEKEAPQESLFGGGGPTAISDIAEPTIPSTEPWSLVTQLNFEREVIGFFLSAHPLDRYAYEVKRYANTTIEKMAEVKEREVRVAAIVTERRERTTKTGSLYLQVSLEDYSGKLDLTLFSKDYEKFEKFFKPNVSLLVSGRFEPSYRDPSTTEFRLREVRLLEGFLEDTVRELQVDLPLLRLEDVFLEQFETTLKNFKGTCGVKVRLTHETVERPVVLSFRRHPIRPTPEFRAELDKLNLTYAFK
jgi:DNA polymerase III subunit alpha